jgi:hypothetical protein
VSGQIHLFDRLLAINGFPPGSPGARVPDHETRVEITILPADPAEAVEELAVETLSVTLEREPDEGFGVGMAFDGEAVILSAIGEGTPAMRCGLLRKGDLVVSINGEPVIASSNFGALIAQEATSISLELMRIVSGGVYEPAEREGAADEQAADDARGDAGAVMGARAHAPSPASSSGVMTTGNLVQSVVQAVFGEDLDKSDAALEAAFALADVSPKMGTLDAHEMRAYIKSVYKNGIDDKTIDEMISKGDMDKDGELSLSEFKAIMRAGPKKSSGAIGGAVDAGVGATVDGVKALQSGVKAVGSATVGGAAFVGKAVGKAFVGEDIDKSDASLEAAFATVDANDGPPIAADCRELPLIAADCRRLPPIAADCRRLPLIGTLLECTVGCQSHDGVDRRSRDEEVHPERVREPPERQDDRRDDLKGRHGQGRRAQPVRVQGHHARRPQKVQRGHRRRRRCRRRCHCGWRQGYK